MVKSLILLAAAVALPAAAQDYPVRDIRSICNFSAGSGADIIVRFYSDRLSKLAGKPVLVENKPGAQGSLASDFVAKSKPDGYTLMITPASSTIATAPHLFKKLPFDPIKDFAPVTMINSLAFVLAVDAAGPIQSVPDLVAHLKKQGSHGFYGTGSNSGQVAAELFKEHNGLNTTYVSFSEPNHRSAPTCCARGLPPPQVERSGPAAAQMPRPRPPTSLADTVHGSLP